MVEEDPRYKAVSDHHERRSMIRSFFIDRERRMRDVHRAKRRENMGALRAVLDKHSSGETPTFHERTSFRQVCDVLAKDPAFLALDEPDRSVVYDEWQNEQRAKVMEARAKEKERKRAQERAKRGAFREKLEELIMSGEIELTARYKDVLPILKEKKWFASTVDQETKTSDLYRDVIDAIEEKLARHKDKFRSILKDAGLSVELGTTFLSIWEKTQPALEENKISKFYAEALFSRQQEKLTVAKKKEEKRVQRIKEDYWDLLRRKEVNEKSSWHEIKVVVSGRSAYKDLVALGGEELPEKSFNEYLAYRSEKEERRRKRHRESEGNKSEVNGDVKKKKVDGDDKLDELQKRKNEILSKLGTDPAAGAEMRDEGEV
mmetsp:Transcript_32274/g.126296  ORF Transcript_32274/g.126296 Transcript_32274/m.126296 type:complete len:375 (-) Transcript_32274:4214-5338(-)